MIPGSRIVLSVTQEHKVEALIMWLHWDTSLYLTIYHPDKQLQLLIRQEKTTTTNKQKGSVVDRDGVEGVRVPGRVV